MDRGGKRRLATITVNGEDVGGTACTNFIRAGINDEEVALIMGWKEETVKHLKRVYVSDRALADGVIARIERTQNEQKL